MKPHTIKNVKDTVWKKFRLRAIKEGKTLAELLELLLK
jgi:plasmid stability protein